MFYSVLDKEIETYQRWKCIPRKERNHKTKPRESENPAILVKGIEHWNRQRFVVTGVCIWGCEQQAHESDCFHLLLGVVCVLVNRKSFQYSNGMIC